MYVFLIEDDNSIFASHKEVIMQREKLVNDIWFLIPPKYNESDMSLFSVTLEYILPVSKKYKTVELVKDPNGYKEYIKYVVPLDTYITSEPGEIELQLSLVYVGLDADGKGVQKVRKTKTSKLKITPIAAWSDIIPDDALSSLDQRIIKLDAQLKQLNDVSNHLGASKADNIEYNAKENSLQLMSGVNKVGDKVTLKDCIDESGVPVVDFDSGSGGQGKPPVPQGNGDVVEF